MTRLCLLAGNYEEALMFAKTQNIPRECWFYPKNENDLLFNSNFYVLVIGSAGQNVPSLFFERVYQLALKRGKIGRTP
jgi:hypothetical protein